MSDKTPEEVQETLDSWEVHLSSFREKYYPVFASYGLSLNEAILLYNNNLLTNNLADLIEILNKEKWE